MAQFLARVELHNATEGGRAYEGLHSAMRAIGFSRAIKGRKGIYRLPPAEYLMEANLTVADVLALARRAAATTRRKHAVLVAEVKCTAWNGLEMVQPLRGDGRPPR